LDWFLKEIIRNILYHFFPLIFKVLPKLMCFLIYLTYQELFHKFRHFLLFIFHFPLNSSFLECHTLQM
jgi:hypothetical protein